MDLTTIDGTPVSRFSFGTMQFGAKADESACSAMYAACRDAGVNFFDTAYSYNEGRSEEITGRLISKERDSVFIATKAANGGTATKDIIDREFDESRKRLGFDTVDLFYIHQPDPETPLEVSLDAVRAHVEAGRVRYVGLSNHSAWQTMKARGIARQMGFDIHVLQPMFNLVKRIAEVEILPMADKEDFAVCPYSPLGGGLLTGKYASGGTGRLNEVEMYSRRYDQDWMYDTARNLADLARARGTHAATLACAWVAESSGIWGPIISAHSVDQLEPSLDAIRFEMDASLYEEIASLSPTPPPFNDRTDERS